MTNADTIRKRIASFLQTSPLNRVGHEIEQIYQEPLVGVACAEDPLFAMLHEDSVVGSHHRSPGYWLRGAQSVISYFLPYSEQVRRSNYTPRLPSLEWLYARVEGEVMNDAVRDLLVRQFRDRGEEAVAPMRDPRFGVIKNRSNWSERHVAFIAGLGTFGLHTSFITEKGCAGRFGSVITTTPIESTTRAYQGTYEYCSECGVCFDRCPARAVGTTGKDHYLCHSFMNQEVSPKFPPRYGCGKCQTAVPCEWQRPT